MADFRPWAAAAWGFALAALTAFGPAAAGDRASANGATPVCTAPAASDPASPAGAEARHDLASAPEVLGDGCPVSTLAAEGLRPGRIAAMLEAIEAWRFKKVDSVLIARRGKLVLEAYFNGFSRETKHDTRSAFKSFASTLVGIAIDRRLIAGVDQSVASLFSGHHSVAGWSDRKRAITLAHLLTMTGGSFLLRPRDMAKLGQVFLDGGTWQGRRIVSRRWVQAATAPRVDAAGPRDIGLEPMIKGYGYQWWTRRWRPGDPRFDGFFASGNGGQKILVFPRLDMVVVFTGSNYSKPLGHKQTRDLLRHYIFVAVAD